MPSLHKHPRAAAWIFVAVATLSACGPVGSRVNDEDYDGDGVPDAIDKFPGDACRAFDTDRDGLADSEDDDIDGDGAPNWIELRAGTDPRDGYSSVSLDQRVARYPDLDLDGDGLINLVDDDDDGDGFTDAREADFDGDYLSNIRDSDDDGDGIPDAADKDKDNDGRDDLDAAWSARESREFFGDDLMLGVLGMLDDTGALASYDLPNTNSQLPYQVPGRGSLDYDDCTLRRAARWYAIDPFARSSYSQAFAGMDVARSGAPPPIAALLDIAVQAGLDSLGLADLATVNGLFDEGFSSRKVLPLRAEASVSGRLIALNTRSSTVGTVTADSAPEEVTAAVRLAGIQDALRVLALPTSATDTWMFATEGIDALAPWQGPWIGSGASWSEAEGTAGAPAPVSAVAAAAREHPSHAGLSTFELYESLLAEGRVVSLLAGGIHTGVFAPGLPTTRVWSNKLSPSALVEAIKAGHTALSASPDGPLLRLEARAGGRRYQAGDELPTGEAEIRLVVDSDVELTLEWRRSGDEFAPSGTDAAAPAGSHTIVFSDTFAAGEFLYLRAYRSVDAAAAERTYAAFSAGGPVALRDMPEFAGLQLSVMGGSAVINPDSATLALLHAEIIDGAATGRSLAAVSGALRFK